MVNIHQTTLTTSQKTSIFIVTAIRTSHVTVENKTEPFTLYSDDKVMKFRSSDLNPVRLGTHSYTGQEMKSVDERKYEGTEKKWKEEVKVKEKKMKK
jgi:hypothetical protein